jgi:hypothetical protein
MTRLVTAAVAAALLLPSLAIAQETSYDFAKGTNFSAYHTYALKEGTPVGNPLIDNRIIEALKTELATKGLTNDDAKPDLFVTYHIAFDKQKDISAWSTGMGPYGWHYGMGSTDVQVREILIGTLVIDMADAAKKEVVWRGVATKEIDTTAKPEKRDKNIQKAVQKILKKYPPEQKKTE